MGKSSQILVLSVSVTSKELTLPNLENTFPTKFQIFPNQLIKF
jgi:hypothetical protein